jgi:4'-phosphopantetheinyl transferase EntD
MEDMDTDLPTPGDVGLALGIARSTELCGFRLHAAEAPLTQGMNPSRRRDFLLGRLAARRALETLGVPDAPILISDGRPRFPAPVAGSISHSEGVGVAIVGFAEAVGVDIELRRLSARAARGVCSAEELAWAGDCSERATLLFSAKESAYKVLPTSLQCALRWSDIAITPRGTAGFTAFVGGTVIDGWWRTGPALLSWAMTRAARAVG